MANEISTLTDLNGVTHDIEDSTARSAIQTLDGQAVKSVNGQTPTAGAVLIGAGNIGYDNTNSGLTADDVQEAVDELNSTLSSHTSNTDIHVTATDKANWNAKADDSAVVKSVNSVNPVTGNVTLNADNIPAEGYGNKSVSGNPITITDGTATTAKNLDVSLTPIQDLHGYDNPWPEGGGVNQWDEEWELGDISYNGGGDLPSTTWIRSKNYCRIVAETHYWCLSGTYRMNVFFYDANKDFIGYRSRISGADIETPQDAYYFRIATEQTTYNNDIAINYPSTVTTYSPYSNICPISGLSSVSVVRTGKNLLPHFGAREFNGVTATVDNDGVISLSGTASALTNIFIEGYLDSSSSKAYVPNGQYILTGGISSNVYIVCRDGGSEGTRWDDKGLSSNITITTGIANIYIVILSGTNTEGMKIYPMLRLASDSDATFEPYQGNTATITLGQTVYQGTVDFDTGLMTVTHGIVDLGTLEWSLITDRFVAYFTGANFPTNDGVEADVVCSNYPVSTWYYGVRHVSEKLIYPYSGMIGLNDSAYADAASLTTALDGVQLVYLLATPLTVQLTPAQLTLLEGYNYITSVANSISMDYYGSEATNVQAEINEFETNLDRLAGSIAQIEVSPATATHAVNTYLVWNSRLYKVISAIAVGENLSIGTNISPTTIMAELLALTA